MVDDEIAAFDVAQGSQALAEGLDTRTLRDGAQKADPVDVPRRLRLGGERRGEEAASDPGDERPSVHQWDH